MLAWKQIRGEKGIIFLFFMAGISPWALFWRGRGKTPECHLRNKGIRQEKFPMKRDTFNIYTVKISVEWPVFLLYYFLAFQIHVDVWCCWGPWDSQKRRQAVGACSIKSMLVLSWRKTCGVRGPLGSWWSLMLGSTRSVHLYKSALLIGLWGY